MLKTKKIALALSSLGFFSLVLLTSSSFFRASILSLGLQVTIALPTNLSADTINRALNWEILSDARIDGYRIYYRDASPASFGGTAYNFFTAANKYPTSFSVSNLSFNTFYDFKIQPFLDGSERECDNDGCRIFNVKFTEPVQEKKPILQGGGNGGGETSLARNCPYRLPENSFPKHINLEDCGVDLPNSGTFTYEVTLTDSRTKTKIHFPLNAKVVDEKGNIFAGIITPQNTWSFVIDVTNTGIPKSVSDSKEDVFNIFNSPKSIWSFIVNFLKTTVPTSTSGNTNFVFGFSLSERELHFDENVEVIVKLPKNYVNNKDLVVYYYNAKNKRYDQINPSNVSLSEDGTALILLTKDFSQFVVVDKNALGKSEIFDSLHFAAEKFLPADVDESHWAYAYLKELFERGIMTGYGDTKLMGPDNNLTRAEAVKMLVLALEKEFKPCVGAPFKDVIKDDWACSYIVSAKKLGWVTGYGNGLFMQAKNISRAEALKILLFAKGVKIEPERKLRFSDVLSTDWFFKIVNYAAEKGIVSGYSNKIFRPNNPITRAEFAKILVETLWIKQLKGEENIPKEVIDSEVIQPEVVVNKIERMILGAKYPITQILSPNNLGDEVRNLQKGLQELGYFQSSISGLYGPATTDAVAKFQTDYNIAKPGDSGFGIFGPKTKAVFDAIEVSQIEKNSEKNVDELKKEELKEAELKTEVLNLDQPSQNTLGVKYPIKEVLLPNSLGDEVRNLQKGLQELGYFQSSISGLYGPATTDAVAKFQTDYNIAKPGDSGFGIFGPKTKAVFNAIEAR